MNQRSSVILSTLGVLFVICWQLGFSDIINAHSYIGTETRDLFDHIALLDQWAWQTEVWNYPSGGRLIPPDLFSMIFASPWLGLGFGRGVAYDLSIVTHLICNAASGWYLGKTTGGSPWVAAIALLCAPFCIGQLNSGETETVGLWGLTLCLATLHQHKWTTTGFLAVITAIGSWYYGAYAATIVGCYSISVYIRKQDWSDKEPLMAPMTMGIGIAIPAWVYSNMLADPSQMFRGPTMETYLTEHPRALAAFSTDPTLWLSEVPKAATHVDGLGWCFALLGMTGIWKSVSDTSWKKHWGWLLLLFMSLLMSLGPRLHVAQTVLWDWMPYDAWMQLPFLSNMRLPHRWMAVATISLTVWIAKGARNMPILACMFLCLESAWFVPRVERTNLEPPSIIEHFDGPILQLPVRTMEWDARGRYLVMQRVHEQPIPYSLLMQGWNSDLTEEPLTIAIAALDSEDPISSRTVEARQFRQEAFALEVTAWGGFPQDKPQTETAERLQQLGFSQVCFHRNLVNSSDREAMEEVLLESLGSPIITTTEAWLWTL